MTKENIMATFLCPLSIAKIAQQMLTSAIGINRMLAEDREKNSAGSRMLVSTVVSLTVVTPLTEANAKRTRKPMAKSSGTTVGTPCRLSGILAVMNILLSAIDGAQ